MCLGNKSVGLHCDRVVHKLGFRPWLGSVFYEDIWVWPMGLICLGLLNRGGGPKAMVPTPWSPLADLVPRDLDSTP